MVIQEGIVVISGLLSLIGLGSSIKCLQCTSLIRPECSDGDLPALECPSSSNFCIKYVGLVMKETVVFRECNINRIEQNCTTKLLEGHRIFVCYETCDADGCNGGPAKSTLPEYLALNSCGQLTGHPAIVTLAAIVVVLAVGWRLSLRSVSSL